MKNPLGVSPSKGYQGTTRGKEKILMTSVGIEPTTSGLDLPLLCRLSYEVGQRKSGTIKVVNRGEEKVRVHIYVVPRSTMNTNIYTYICTLFNFNTDSNVNPDRNLNIQPIQCKYYSPHSLSQNFREQSSVLSNHSHFSLLHNNVRSLRRNLDHHVIFKSIYWTNCSYILTLSE